MKEIKFKAWKPEAMCCRSYREIIKTGDLDSDLMKFSDDVIIIPTKNIEQIHIDCDSETREFRVFWH